MNNNENSNVRKSSIEKNYTETPKLDNHLYRKRKDPFSFSNSMKNNNTNTINPINNNENGVFNQFTLTAFNSFKTNKNILIKSDQSLMSGNYMNNNITLKTNRKENIGNSTKNNWSTDIRGSASPTKLIRISAPSSKKKFFQIQTRRDF